MPFTTHRLEEIREGTARARCTRCGQTWTSWHVRSACPGVPVYAYEETPPYLKTLFTLERERKYPPGNLITTLWVFRAFDDSGKTLFAC